jgi:hydroxymethylbilane synthase
VSELVRVGTRRSALALAQTAMVLAALRRTAPELRFEPVALATAGDRTRAVGVPLDFTDAIDRALEDGEVDLAVHSSKDLPARVERPVRVAAYPRRADPRDCLVLRGPGSLRALPAGARIGSSSLRRRAQLLRARPDLTIVEVRGNIDTRIRLVGAGSVDGVVLARAGLDRLERSGEASETLDPRRFLPAPGQGALAVAVRARDASLARRVRTIDDGPTRAAVTAERAVSESLGGDCNLPLGALARVRGGRLQIRAEVLAPDGTRKIHGVASGPARSARSLGLGLGGRLAREGARALVESSLSSR